MRVLELVMNRLSAEESDFIFTESGTVERATFNEEDGTYTLVMRKKTDKDITPFQQGDILKGVMNDLTKDGAVGVNYYTSWVQVKEVNQTANSIKVAVYTDDDTPAKKNFPPCNLMVLHRWGNTTKKERQSCWYISSIEKRIVMLDGVTKPILEESNYASFYGLPFDMENFKGYALNKNQPYLYVRGAFLQDVCFIDYLGQVVKQERYRGVWSQEVANNSDDPYIVTQTTFDTVYHKNAKWQCKSTTGSKVEPSVGTTDWTMLTDGGEAITVDSTDVYYCIFSSGEYAPNDNYEGWTNAIVPTPTKEKPYLWTRTRWYFSDGTITPTYTVVRNGNDGRNLTKVTNYYKWGANGDTAPSEPYAPDTIPTHVEGSDYLWNYEVCSDDKEDTISQSGKTCIGYFPKDGDPGKGIRSITVYYQVGTERKPTNGITVNSDNELDTTGWKTSMDPTTNENRFVWNQEVIQFTDGTYSISVIHLAGAQGENGADGADGALPNLFGYDTKVECLVGHHNVVHTKTGFALALDSISDDDTSSDRYCLLRIKNITAGEGTYSISGYITHGRGGKFEFDCGDVTPQTMYLTANKRTRFEKKFVLPKNSYKHVDFEFFAGGYIVNIEELKIERTDNVVSDCTPFVTLAHDSITQKQNILLDTNFQKTDDRTIWNAFNGDIVENAYNGLPAFHYKDTRSSSTTTAVEVLSQKFVGKLKPSTWYTLSMFTKVKGKVIPYIGSNVTRNWNQTGKNKGADAVLCDEHIVSTSATTNTQT